MFGKRLNELCVPPDAKSDPKATEIARVWVAHDQMHVTISADAWEDPGCWGIALVDLARHVANYCHDSRGMNREEVLTSIKHYFDAEWEKPTSEATGKVLE